MPFQLSRRSLAIPSTKASAEHDAHNNLGIAVTQISSAAISVDRESYGTQIESEFAEGVEQDVRRRRIDFIHEIKFMFGVPPLCIKCLLLCTKFVCRCHSE